MVGPESVADRLPAEAPPEPAFPDRVRLIKLGLFTVLALALCVFIALPFLPALTWGMALAVIAWPLHHWVARHLPYRALAAGLTSFVVVAAVVGSGLFVTYHLAREAGTQAAKVQQESTESTIREAMARTPGMAAVVEWMDRVHLDIDAATRQVVERYTSDASALVNGSVWGIIQFVVAVFILFHFLKDRGAILDGVRYILPLTRPEADRVFGRVADTVHANLYATLVTSLIDGVGGGLLFWALGLPAPVTWGVVMFILSVLPVLGTFIVWAPVALYLALVGNWVGALVLAGWGVGSWFVVDNFIYVRLAGPRMRMHQVPALIAFLGGLAVFGVSGMIVGPAIAGMTLALLDVWTYRSAAAGAATAAPPTVNGKAGPVTV